MQVKMKLYATYDYDLCLLNQCEDFFFSKEIKNALYHHVRGEAYPISLPSTLRKMEAFTREKKIEITDPLSEAYLVNLIHRKRNAFLKYLIRSSIEGDCSFLFESRGISSIKKKESLNESEKKIVKKKEKKAVAEIKPPVILEEEKTEEISEEASSSLFQAFANMAENY